MICNMKKKGWGEKMRAAAAASLLVASPRRRLRRDLAAQTLPLPLPLLPSFRSRCLLLILPTFLPSSPLLALLSPPPSPPPTLCP